MWVRSAVVEPSVVIALSTGLLAVGVGQTVWLYDTSEAAPLQQLHITRRSPMDRDLQTV